MDIEERSSQPIEVRLQKIIQKLTELADTSNENVEISKDSLAGIIQVLQSGLNHIQRLNVTNQMNKINENLNKDREQLEREMMYSELEMMKQTSWKSNETQQQPHKQVQQHLPHSPQSPKRKKDYRKGDIKLHTFHHYYNANPINDPQLGKVTSSLDNRKRRRVSNDK